MKVITVKQPFASLIAEGYKEYEFRTWKTKYRGDILIHAGKGVNKKAMKRFEHLHLEYPSGCMIARATLKDCIKIDTGARDMLMKKDPLVYATVIQDTEWKGYGFQLENVTKINPIPVNGKLSLWEYEYKEDSE